MPAVSEIMTTDPVSISPNESVQTAARLMKTNHVGSIPVLEGERKLVGILTDRDLAIKVISEGRAPVSTSVADVMSRKVLTCGPNDDVESAIQTMEEHQIRRIPVVDDQQRLVGIVAQADVATRFDEPRRVAKAVGKISRPTDAECK